MTDVIMPRLSDSMIEGTVAGWLVEDRSEVRRGQSIVEIETDKATMSYEADADGTLSILASQGATLPVGSVIATIGKPSTESGSLSGLESPESARAYYRNGELPNSGARADRAPRPSEESRHHAASPVARRLARLLSIDLESVAGSGPGGRILKADVRAAEAEREQERGGAADVPPTPASSGLPERTPHRGEKGDAQRLELDSRARIVARRMSDAKATAPEFSVQMAVDMDAALTLRQELANSGIKISVNDLVVKAAAKALVLHPHINASYRDGAVETYSRINVGIAVSSGRDLIVPTLFDADVKSISALASEARELIVAVNDGTITAAQMSGGTFTVSNLGMYGVLSFEAVLNPPQAGILAVGGIRNELDFDAAGEVVARRRLIVTLVSDHRVVYGADAAAFLVTLRQLLESPLGLIA